MEAASATDAVHNVIILGSGCAGLTAALYAARALLKPLVLQGENMGGQLATTTLVENYPGFIDGIDGPELTERMQRQAERFGARMQVGSVRSLQPGKPYHTLTLNDDKILVARTLIIATGASPRKLGLASEKQYWGKGVATCATCDASLYRGKEVCIIGGGDTALEEAQFIARFASRVYVIHRRKEFRATRIILDSALANQYITPIMNSVVVDITGNGQHVTGVTLKDANDDGNNTRHLQVAGVFLAIGHIPNSEPFKQCLKLDEQGFIITEGKNSTQTSVEGIFACGDVADPVYRQAVTAAGFGCAAAIDAERWLAAQSQQQQQKHQRSAPHDSQPRPHKRC